MELLSDFVNVITNNEDYRTGFLSGLVLIGVIWLASWLFFRIYTQWLKVRQFFEPIKTPARTPTEAGPSPARMLLGCVGRVIIAVLGIALLFLLWIGMTPSG
jgi:hypothetical protein